MDAKPIQPQSRGISSSRPRIDRYRLANLSRQIFGSLNQVLSSLWSRIDRGEFLTLWGLGTGGLLMLQAAIATWGVLEPWRSCALVALCLGAGLGSLARVQPRRAASSLEQTSSPEKPLWKALLAGSPPLGAVLLATCVWFWLGPLWYSIPAMLPGLFSVEFLAQRTGLIPVAFLVAMSTVGVTSALCVWSLRELAQLRSTAAHESTTNRNSKPSLEQPENMLAQSCQHGTHSSAKSLACAADAKCYGRLALLSPAWMAGGVSLGMGISAALLAYGASPSILLGLAGLATGMPAIRYWMSLEAEVMGSAHAQRHTSRRTKDHGLETSWISHCLLLMAAILAGSFAWGMERLVNDRMPTGTFVMTGLALGGICGWALSAWMNSRRSRMAVGTDLDAAHAHHKPADISTSAMIWMGVVAIALNLLLLPALTELLLWTNATVSWSPGVWWIRMLFTILMVWPVGWLMGCATTRRSGSMTMLCLMLAAAGWLTAQWFGRFVLSPASLLLACSWALAALSVIPLVLNPRMLRDWVSPRFGKTFAANEVTSSDHRTQAGSPSSFAMQSGHLALSTRMASLFSVVAGAGLLATLPWSVSRESSAWNSRALFSTSASVAWHAGFSSDMLTALDDSRLVEVEHAENGTMVRWRTKFLEEVTRVNGLPLPPVSRDPGVVPQAVPELILTTLPLALHHEARHILLLGAGSGLPLVTLSDLPVLQVTCLEGDGSCLQAVQSHVVRALGAEIDERFDIHGVDPVWGISSLQDRFDVVISAPQLSSTDRGTASLTREHYLQCADRLTEDGIFCQRFECVDYGPQVLVDVSRTLRSVFREVTLVQTGIPGEAVWIATNSSKGLMREGLLSRIKSPQMRRILAQAGWDWSMLAGLSLVDDAALGELDGTDSKIHLRHARANTIRSNHLAWQTPIETMRWGAKLQQTQALLSAPRSTEPVYPPLPIPVDPDSGEEPPPVVYRRLSLLMEGMGFDGEDPDLVRRLEEIVAQRHLINDHPEAWWWEYRKVVKERLGKPPVATVRLATAQALKGGMLPDYARRKDYFEHLGEAIRSPNPAAEVPELLKFEEAYDPLLSPFIHQEVAELLHRSGKEARAEELRHRLHLVYFAPGFDSSVRNVQVALEMVLDHPETIVDDAARYDLILSLMHTMRNRWNLRTSQTLKSIRLTLRDIDACLLVARRGKETLDQLALAGAADHADCEKRLQGLDRMLLQPLETYRNNLRSATPEFKDPSAVKPTSK
ncbi:spermidine synthase [Planctopirus hydrillae]|uniref:PABS domain-containing protein n=1 Tax=Planctopirus hydrillae TaxID=1841610 RepID=A0A1C3E6N4_9PLAN|nr:hypothetical protein [Planctopirus hydrillae]ODA28915.1 hypothetical protein A6X21_10475 [Planctopirus hydrillae]